MKPTSSSAKQGVCWYHLLLQSILDEIAGWLHYTVCFLRATYSLCPVGRYSILNVAIVIGLLMQGDNYGYFLSQCSSSFCSERDGFF